MIAKHIHCLPEHDNYARLAAYIADARSDSGHEGEKCLASWCAGCAADDDYELAVLEAEAVQALNNHAISIPLVRGLEVPRVEKTYNTHQ